MKKNVIISGFLFLIVLGISCIFSRNSQDDNILYYAKKLGLNGDSTAKESILQELGSPNNDNGETLFYDLYSLTFNSNDELVKISTNNSSVKILRNDVSVGYSIQDFYSAYSKNISDGVVVLFHGKYSLKNYTGIEIFCEEDASGIISQITVTQVTYK